MPKLILFFGMLILIFSIISCTSIKKESYCCQQCLDAASQDPTGYDISIKECSRYELSEGCTTYFEQKGVRVGECREMEK